MLLAGLEVRRLPEIGTTRLDAVVGADGDVQRLAAIAVVVAEQQNDRPVLVRPPSFERGVDGLAAPAERLGGQRRPW